MNYWHMQLHDDDKKGWKREDILEILKQSLVGCTGKPVEQFNQIKAGDIILIRHGGDVLALTQALENPRTIKPDEKNDYVWFEHGLKVKILEYYNNKSVSGKGWFLPKTLMYIENEIAYGFVNQLYKEFKDKTMLKDIITLLKYKTQIILQGAPGTGKTYTAKDVAYQLIFDAPISTENDKRKADLEKLSKSDQFSLIQFHPAYSYEDFVRGISAKANGQGIEYKTEDKILAEFAQEAYQNYLDSEKEVQQLSEEKQLEAVFEDFKESIESEIAKNQKFDINEIAYIYGIEDDAFRYKGDNWNNNQRMKFDDILKLHLANISERKQIKHLDDVSGLAKQHSTYYILMLKKFQAFIKDKTIETTPVEKVALKNYVLIIDEINRANLPAVLGELIYALEYRGESVESMYDLDGDRSLILPPNLYIIGTMNTADRSVGHIDYAIRRRFAFVPIAADENVITLPRAKSLFKHIRETFFDKEKGYLSSDFEATDVELGHSYYLAKDDAELALKLKYEIIPLLEEYLKDGVLLNSAKEHIKQLK